MATTFIRTEMARWLARAGASPQSTDAPGAGNLYEKRQPRYLGASLSNPQYAGMGTTLVVAVFHGSRLILGHMAICAATACAMVLCIKSRATIPGCRSRSMQVC